MPFEEQTVSIFAGTNGYIDDVAVERVGEYEEQMLAFFRSEHAGMCSKTIRDTRSKFEGDVKDATVAALDAFAKQFA